jgi:hypothetical protein
MLIIILINLLVFLAVWYGGVWGLAQLTRSTPSLSVFEAPEPPLSIDAPEPATLRSGDLAPCAVCGSKEPFVCEAYERP